MKQPNSFDRIRQKRLPAGGPTILATTSFVSATERLMPSLRAERLFQMGELVAAADLMVQETIQ